GFPAQPFDTVVDGDGNAWISSSYEDHAPAKNAFLTRLEAGTGGTSPGTLYPSHAQTIDLPLPMSGFETLGGGYLWVIVGGHGPLPGDDRLALVDLRTNQVASVRRLRDSATSIAFGYGSAWIGTYTSGGNSWVEAIRAGGSKVTKVLLERGVYWGPAWIAVGEGAVWALTAMPWASRRAGPELIEIDPQTLQVLHRLSLSSEQSGAVAVGAGAVWTTGGLGGGNNRTADGVTKIDPRTDRIIRTFPLGDRTRVTCGIAATPSAVLDAASPQRGSYGLSTSRFLHRWPQASIQTFAPLSDAAGWHARRRCTPMLRLPRQTPALSKCFCVSPAIEVSSCCTPEVRGEP